MGPPVGVRRLVTAGGGLRRLIAARGLGLLILRLGLLVLRLLAVARRLHRSLGTVSVRVGQLALSRRCRGRALADLPKVHRRGLAHRGVIDLEVGGLLELGETSDDVGRHRLDLGVVLAHISVIEPAGGRDAILGLGQLTLQRNSALLFNRAGQLVKRYSKVHPFGYDSGERDLVTGGSALPVTALDDARGTRVGSAICYDLRFAGLWDELRRRGAEIIVLPAAWPASRGEAREVLVRARAIEQQAFVVAAACAGAHGGVEMSGQSMIVGPDGSVIARAEGNTEQVVRATIDPEQAEQLRQEFPVYADRLADYRGLD